MMHQYLDRQKILLQHKQLKMKKSSISIHYDSVMHQTNKQKNRVCSYYHFFTKGVILTLFKPKSSKIVLIKIWICPHWPNIQRFDQFGRFWLNKCQNHISCLYYETPYITNTVCTINNLNSKKWQFYDQMHIGINFRFNLGKYIKNSLLGNDLLKSRLYEQKLFIVLKGVITTTIPVLLVVKMSFDYYHHFHECRQRE